MSAGWSTYPNARVAPRHDEVELVAVKPICGGEEQQPDHRGTRDGEHGPWKGEEAEAGLRGHGRPAAVIGRPRGLLPTGGSSGPSNAAAGPGRQGWTSHGRGPTDRSWPPRRGAVQGAGVSGSAGAGVGSGATLGVGTGVGGAVGTGVGEGVGTGVGEGVVGGVGNGGGTTTGSARESAAGVGRAVALGLGLGVRVGRAAGRAGAGMGGPAARRVEAALALGAGAGGGDAAPAGGGVADETIPAPACDGSKMRRAAGSIHAGSTVGWAVGAGPRAGPTGLEVGPAATMPATAPSPPGGGAHRLIVAAPARAMTSAPITAPKTRAMRASPWRAPPSRGRAIRRRPEATGETYARCAPDSATVVTPGTGTAGSSRQGSPNMTARRCVATCSIAERSSASASRRRRTTGDTLASALPRSQPRTMRDSAGQPAPPGAPGHRGGSVNPSTHAQ